MSNEDGLKKLRDINRFLDAKENDQQRKQILFRVGICGLVTILALGTAYLMSSRRK